MQVEFSELEGGIRLIKLSGRLDMEGTNLVEPKFHMYCEGDQVFVLVDFSEVSYLSSIGIPMLINNARAVEKRGGRLALLNPQSSVRAILDMAGVLHVIRMYKDIETALDRIKVA